MATMTLSVPDEIAHSLEELSRRTGRSTEDLLLCALRAHFPPLEPDLQAELDAWGLAADEDAASFEGREGIA